MATVVSSKNCGFEVKDMIIFVFISFNLKGYKIDQKHTPVFEPMTRDK